MDGLGKRRGGTHIRFFRGVGAAAPRWRLDPPPFSPGGCFVAAVSAGARWEPRPAAGGGGVASGSPLTPCPCPAGPGRYHERWREPRAAGGRRRGAGAHPRGAPPPQRAAAGGCRLRSRRFPRCRWFPRPRPAARTGLRGGGAGAVPGAGTHRFLLPQANHPPAQLVPQAGL